MYKRFITCVAFKKRGDYEKCFYKVLRKRDLGRLLWE